MPSTEISAVPPYISLRDFVATGDFGQVRLGTSKESVERDLGTPDLWNDEPAVWKYGGVEIYFASKGDSAAEGTVWMVFTDDFDSTAAWVDCWVFNPDLTMNEAKEHLEKQGVPSHETDVPALSDNYYLITESGVHLQFSNYVYHGDNEEQGEPKLVAVFVNVYDRPEGGLP